ncbi:uncharacterized protein LOC142777400 isoform X3 [Rhipicephalus microplus]|uniref:uncharacterized protein LOC142777400 isoform X3 n=1 Tax=Rhipicephalus microplus TaxID=6941 RepID=UPI003F6CB1C3
MRDMFPAANACIWPPVPGASGHSALTMSDHGTAASMAVASCLGGTLGRCTYPVAPAATAVLGCHAPSLVGPSMGPVDAGAWPLNILSVGGPEGSLVRKKRRCRTAFNKQQLSTLEKTFGRMPYPDTETRDWLAVVTGLPESRIQGAQTRKSVQVNLWLLAATFSFCDRNPCMTSNNVCTKVCILYSNVGL